MFAKVFASIFAIAIPVGLVSFSVNLLPKNDTPTASQLIGQFIIIALATVGTMYIVFLLLTQIWEESKPSGDTPKE
jgi:hypothetical protein